MKAPGQIETTRLILRQPKMGDAVTMFERYASDLKLPDSWAGRAIDRFETQRPSCSSARRNGSDGRQDPT